MVGAMNGAEAMIRTLVDAGVTTCFTNPGTSEMHFVAALDNVPEMRGVLGLFEGVATGAADGYARMAGRPAATLLHLGPGLGNGLANLHNARRAATPIVNIVGDHATYHVRLDAPLNSDIEHRRAQRVGLDRATGAHGRPVPRDRRGRRRGRRPTGPGRHAHPARRRVVERRRRTGAPAAVAGRRRRSTAATVELVAKVLRSGEPVALLLGGSAHAATGRSTPPGRIAAATGARLFAETFVGPHRARRRHPRRREVAVLRRDGPAAARRAAPPRARRRPARPCRSSPTRTSRASSCPTAARSTCWPTGADDVAGALDARRRARRRRQSAVTAAAPHARRARPAS